MQLRPWQAVPPLAHGMADHEHAQVLRRLTLVEECLEEAHQVGMLQARQQPARGRGIEGRGPWLSPRQVPASATYAPRSHSFPQLRLLPST